MRKHDLDPVVVEWLFAREVCRRLGFTPDEIHFAVYRSGAVADADGTVRQCDGPIVSLEIRRGELEFRWTIGVTTLLADRIQAEYERACARWNSDALGISQGDFLASQPARQAMALMVALTEKGFTFRAPERSAAS